MEGEGVFFMEESGPWTSSKAGKKINLEGRESLFLNLFC